MSQNKSKDKERAQAGGKKLTIKKDAIKDLMPRRDVRAGVAESENQWNKLASNHCETLVIDIATKRRTK